MEDQAILITGALVGIGSATALAAASEGYRIVVAGCDIQTGQVLETELIVYPESSHAPVYQYPALFLAEAALFLNA